MSMVDKYLGDYFRNETLEFYGWMLDNCNFNEDEKTLV